MKFTQNRRFSLLLVIVLLIVMTACTKSSPKAEAPETGSSGPSGQIEEEEAQLAEDAMQLLQRADEDAQKKYDNLDLNSKESVIEMIRALEQVQSAINLVRDQKTAAWDVDGKTLSIGQEIRRVSVGNGEFPTIISYMKGQKGLVIAHYGGDNYCYLYVCDGTLIGRESGHSTGRLDFSGCLPDWKDDSAGETQSIIDGR